MLLLAASPNNGSQARLLGRGKPLFVATDAHPASAQGGELGLAMSASSLSLGEGGGRGFISEAPDTVRYAVQKTSPDNEKDLERKPADLRNPENLTTETTYDENRHFFLAHYFRDTYDRNMTQLPTIMSSVVITRVELWVTNKTSSYDSPRNVIAFTDLGEPSRISNPLWTSTGERMPNNTAKVRANERDASTLAISQRV